MAEAENETSTGTGTGTGTGADGPGAAGAGVELLVELPPGERGRGALERALRAAIHSGRLPGGTPMPPYRGLAADLGLARNTVAEVYGQLVAEGYLRSRAGAGTWVAELPAAATPPNRDTGADRWPPEPEPPRWDLRPGRPDVTLFPRAAWTASARRALAAAPATALDYGDPRGQESLRRALARYLGRVRGVHAHPETIVVCAGFTQALVLTARALREVGAGSRFAVEDPTTPRVHTGLRGEGVAVVPVPVDADGAVTAALGGDVAAAVLTPAHQFPTGVALQPRRRAEAVRWAVRTGGVIVEDDYDGEFRYDRQPIGALQGLAPEQTIYVGTASKSLAPAVRLAWMVVPRWLLPAVSAAKARLDRHNALLDQLALADFLDSGQFDRHVRRLRIGYRRRRDALLAALEGLPVTAAGIAAGLHVVIPLPERPGGTAATMEAAALARGARHGLAVTGMGYFAWSAPRPPALVVGYGTPPGHAFRGCLTALRATLTEDAGADPGVLGRAPLPPPEVRYPP